MQDFIIFYSLNIFVFKLLIFWPMRLHPVLIIQSNCSYILALILDWATIICSSVLETTLHLVVKLSFDIYLLITVQFCSPNLDKKFFYWFQHWFFLWFFYFPANFIVLLKLFLWKKSVMLFVHCLSAISVFFSCSIDLYLLDYLG